MQVMMTIHLVANLPICLPSRSTATLNANLAVTSDVAP